MATLRVLAGLNRAIRLPETAVWVVGQSRHLRALKYTEGLSEKFGDALAESGWQRALELNSPVGSLPLVFNLAKVFQL